MSVYSTSKKLFQSKDEENFDFFFFFLGGGGGGDKEQINKIGIQKWRFVLE